MTPAPLLIPHALPQIQSPRTVPLSISCAELEFGMISVENRASQGQVWLVDPLAGCAPECHVISGRAYSLAGISNQLA